jgi:DNA-binding NtrC family response regulator
MAAQIPCSFGGSASVSRYMDFGGPCAFRDGSQEPMTSLHMDARRRLGFPGLGEIVGGSQAMQETYRSIEALGRQMPDALVITGEPGTGKALAARALHAISSPTPRPLVTVDCATVDRVQMAALVESLSDPTHALGEREAVSGGTLLLCGVDALDEDRQRELSDALDECDRRGPVRLLATTGASLREKAAGGAFHAKLYHRLSGPHLSVPPLRARSGDGDLLFRYFLHDEGRRSGRRVHQVSGDVLRRVEEYDWPGNVRELAAVARRCAVSSRGDRVEARTLPKHVGDVTSAASGLEPKHVRFLLPKDGVVLDHVERDLIVQALERTGGNQSRAARLLGINRFALRTRMRRYDLFDEDASSKE